MMSNNEYRSLNEAVIQSVTGSDPVTKPKLDEQTIRIEAKGKYFLVGGVYIDREGFSGNRKDMVSIWISIANF